MKRGHLQAFIVQILQGNAFGICAKVDEELNIVHDGPFKIADRMAPKEVLECHRPLAEPNDSVVAIGSFFDLQLDVVDLCN